MIEDKEEDKKTNAAKAAFGENLEAVYQSLKVLYIPENLSGRNKFREKWPTVASYLFKEDLIEYDDHGVKDREHRKKLEKEADERRAEMLEQIDDLRLKSVKSGTLQVEYISEIMEKYGVDIACLLYKDDILERVRPGVTSQKKEIKMQDRPKKEVTSKQGLDETIKPIMTQETPDASSIKVSTEPKTQNRSAIEKKQEDIPNKQDTSSEITAPSTSAPSIFSSSTPENTTAKEDVISNAEHEKKASYAKIFNDLAAKKVA